MLLPLFEADGNETAGAVGTERTLGVGGEKEKADDAMLLLVCACPERFPAVAAWELLPPKLFHEQYGF